MTHKKKKKPEPNLIIQKIKKWIKTTRISLNDNLDIIPKKIVLKMLK
jgi:hypothetical protein